MSDDVKAKNGEEKPAPAPTKTMEKTDQSGVEDVMQKHVQAKEGLPALVTKFQYQAGFDTNSLGAKIVELLMSATAAPGFVNAEIIPPEHTEVHEWLLIQRFNSQQQVESWRATSERQTAVKSISGTLQGLTIVDDTKGNAPGSNVVTAIVTDVKEGKEAEYKQWETKVQTAQAKFPGYRGAYLQPPLPGAQHAHWTTLLRFDKPESLDKWFHSDVRHALVDEGNELVKKVDFLKITGSFPGWFPTDKTGKAIPNWKTAPLVLLGLFPIVMTEIRFLAPLLKGINPAVANLFSLAISCACTTWVTMPLFIPLFKWWLLPKDDAPAWNDMAGFGMVLGLYAILVALFWNLLS